MSKGPWKKKNVLLAGELQDEGSPEIDLTEEEANALVPVPEPAPEPVAPAATPVVASTPITMTLGDLQAVMATVASGNAALADAVTKGIADAREPIPENKIGPGVSEANPLGDREHPRPGLKCKFTYGTQDARTKIIHHTYPIEAQDLTVYEQIALNTLEPAHATIKRLDGAPMKVSVVPERDPVTDDVIQMTIVVPTDVTAKGSQIKNMLPGVLSVVQQLTGRDFSALSLSDLAWFMAEHRAKRYVSEREPVAA